MKSSKHGFTLVELLITIAIIGILAAMVLPRLFGPTEQSRSAEARHFLGAIRALEQSILTGPQGRYLELSDDTSPADGACDDLNETNQWATLGMNDPNENAQYFGYCVDQVNTSPATFLIVATRNGNASGDFLNKTICLNQDGDWSGDHPHRPQNPGGANCGSPCCPG